MSVRPTSGGIRGVQRRREDPAFLEEIIDKEGETVWKGFSYSTGSRTARINVLSNPLGSTAQIGFADVVVLQQIRGVAGHGDGAGLEDIGPVGDG